MKVNTFEAVYYSEERIKTIKAEDDNDLKKEFESEEKRIIKDYLSKRIVSLFKVKSSILEHPQGNT